MKKSDIKKWLENEKSKQIKKLEGCYDVILKGEIYNIEKFFQIDEINLKIQPKLEFVRNEIENLNKKLSENENFNPMINVSINYYFMRFLTKTDYILDCNDYGLQKEYYEKPKREINNLFDKLQKSILPLNAKQSIEFLAQYNLNPIVLDNNGVVNQVMIPLSDQEKTLLKQLMGC